MYIWVIGVIAIKLIELIMVKIFTVSVIFRIIYTRITMYHSSIFVHGPEL